MAATPLIAFGLFISGAPGPARASDADTAERAYQAGRYEQAMENYQKAAEGQPARNDLHYNAGAAAYKAGDYSEAEEAFRQALETPDLALQENAYYNLGNAQYQDGAALQKVDSKKTIRLWEQALHSYDSALKLRTTADAKHNYDLVKEKLEQLKKQQQQQEQQDKQDSSNPDNKDQSGKDSPQDQGQDKNQQPSQSGQNNPQNRGQNSSQSPQQTGNKPDGPKPGSADKDGNQVRAYSGTRTQDQQDPAIKSRQDAENLLDSLKDDERHFTARSFNQDNQPPPTASGKDW